MRRRERMAKKHARHIPFIRVTPDTLIRFISRRTAKHQAMWRSIYGVKK